MKHLILDYSLTYGWLGVLAAYLLWLSLGRLHSTFAATIPRSTWQLGSQIGASGVLTALFFTFWPIPFIADDGAIILKYMDNFARGFFYSYNPADGPVFGISGFLHGILAGTLAYLHLFSPLGSLFASNACGFFLISLVTLRLLSIYVGDELAVFPLWIALITTSTQLVMDTKQGLEVPLHLAIVLGSLLAYLRERPRFMWLCFSLAIISKLDAVPVIAILALMHVVRSWSRGGRRPLGYECLRLAVWYGAVPLLIWVVFTRIVFGGVFPQTAYAKLVYHPHPVSGPLSFVRPLLADASHVIKAVLFAVCLGGALAHAVLRRREWLWTHSVFGLCALAYLALYCAYNPAEQMSWYYVVPEFLMLVQILVVAAAVSRGLAPSHLRLCAFVIFLALWLAFWPATAGSLNHGNLYATYVEGERIAAGRWIDAHGRPSDVVLAAHGHVAREARRYVVDATGLNSRVATAYKLNWNRLVEAVEPTWIVKHGIEARPGYVLRRSFYSITLFGHPALRVYERETVSPAGDERSRREIEVIPPLIETDGTVSERRVVSQWSQIDRLVTGSGIRTRFRLEPSGWPRYFVIGIQREPHDLMLRATLQGLEGELWRKVELTVHREDFNALEGGLIAEVTIPTASAGAVGSLEIEGTDAENGDRVRVRWVQPLWEQVGTGPNPPRESPRPHASSTAMPARS
jgi:hypothetical protein